MKNGNKKAPAVADRDRIGLRAWNTGQPRPKATALGKSETCLLPDLRKSPNSSELLPLKWVCCGN